jgi:hypothetical protein
VGVFTREDKIMIWGRKDDEKKPQDKCLRKNSEGSAYGEDSDSSFTSDINNIIFTKVGILFFTLVRRRKRRR